jgi:hypothetical protein
MSNERQKGESEEFRREKAGSILGSSDDPVQGR